MAAPWQLATSIQVHVPGSLVRHKLRQHPLQGLQLRGKLRDVRVVSELHRLCPVHAAGDLALPPYVLRGAPLRLAVADAHQALPGGLGPQAGGQRVHGLLHGTLLLQRREVQVRARPHLAHALLARVENVEGGDLLCELWQVVPHAGAHPRAVGERDQHHGAQRGRCAEQLPRGSRLVRQLPPGLVVARHLPEVILLLQPRCGAEGVVPVDEDQGRHRLPLGHDGLLVRGGLQRGLELAPAAQALQGLLAPGARGLDADPAGHGALGVALHPLEVHPVALAGQLLHHAAHRQAPDRLRAQVLLRLHGEAPRVGGVHDLPVAVWLRFWLGLPHWRRRGSCWQWRRYRLFVRVRGSLMGGIRGVDLLLGTSAGRLRLLARLAAPLRLLQVVEVDHPARRLLRPAARRSSKGQAAWLPPAPGVMPRTSSAAPGAHRARCRGRCDGREGA
mmetsp:Transcript_7446/g.23406  ORF Transcript_7446/g.23406 Transcript_7446/m.23406 type:complete len:446 (+) Transcript_7446:42-1379(+)